MPSWCPGTSNVLSCSRQVVLHDGARFVICAVLGGDVLVTHVDVLAVDDDGVGAGLGT